MRLPVWNADAAQRAKAIARRLIEDHSHTAPALWSRLSDAQARPSTFHFAGVLVLARWVPALNSWFDEPPSQPPLRAVPVVSDHGGVHRVRPGREVAVEWVALR
jgi:hypothetical protein